MTLSTDVHISSLIIQTTPDATASVVQMLARLNEIEVVHIDSEKEKIIAVLESTTTKSIQQKIDTIEKIDGVLCAALVYHHAESSHSLNEVLI